MKLAVEIFLLVMAVISGIGFIGEKDNQTRPYYLAGTVIFILMILLANAKM